MKFIYLFLICFLCGDLLTASEAPKLKPQQWIKTIDKFMPLEATVKAPKRKVLVFSLATGYKHYVIPYVDEVFKRMAEKTQAFDVVVSKDIEMFNVEKLQEFDAVILNNTCSDRKERNLFRDVLINKSIEYGKKYQDLSEEQKKLKAALLEQNLINYVMAFNLICGS